MKKERRVIQIDDKQGHKSAHPIASTIQSRLGVTFKYSRKNVYGTGCLCMRSWLCEYEKEKKKEKTDKKDKSWENVAFRINKERNREETEANVFRVFSKFKCITDMGHLVPSFCHESIYRQFILNKIWKKTASDNWYKLIWPTKNTINGILPRLFRQIIEFPLNLTASRFRIVFNDYFWTWSSQAEVVTQ